MTTKERPAAVARALTGAGTAIAMIGMITGFQVSAAAAENQAQLDAAATAVVANPTVSRGQAVRVLDPSLLPDIVVAAPIASSAVTSTPTSSRSRVAAAAPVAPTPPAPAPAPAKPAPPANGTTSGSGG